MYISWYGKDSRAQVYAFLLVLGSRKQSLFFTYILFTHVEFCILCLYYLFKKYTLLLLLQENKELEP